MLEPRLRLIPRLGHMAIIKRLVHVWCDFQTLVGDDLRICHYL
jgi:hypothetical protein